jgi:hypothetical protein
VDGGHRQAQLGGHLIGRPLVQGNVAERLYARLPRASELKNASNNLRRSTAK